MMSRIQEGAILLEALYLSGEQCPVCEAGFDQFYIQDATLKEVRCAGCDTLLIWNDESLERAE